MSRKVDATIFKRDDKGNYLAFDGEFKESMAEKPISIKVPVSYREKFESIPRQERVKLVRAAIMNAIDSKLNEQN